MILDDEAEELVHFGFVVWNNGVVLELHDHELVNILGLNLMIQIEFDKDAFDTILNLCDLFFNFLLCHVLIVKLGSRLEHLNLFGLFPDLAFVTLDTSILILCSQLLFKVEVLIEDSVSVQMGFANAFLSTEAIVQLFIDVVDHDVLAVLEFQYS